MIMKAVDTGLDVDRYQAAPGEAVDEFGRQSQAETTFGECT